MAWTNGYELKWLYVSVRPCGSEAVLADEGWLTDMRTAAAGALGAKAALSRSGSTAAGWQQRKLTVAVLGAGVQAGFRV